MPTLLRLWRRRCNGENVTTWRSRPRLPSIRPPDGLVLGILSATGLPPGELLAMVDAEQLAYAVVESDDVSTGLDHPGEVDAVLLDLTGLAIAQVDALMPRVQESALPLLVVLSRSQLVHPGPRVPGSEFIIAPWQPGELALRVQVLARKRPGTLDGPGIVRVGDLVIDTNQYDVYVGNRPVLLTFKEYEMLKLLASNAGRVFTREALLEQVWGYEYFGGTRTVDVHIRRLRSKIEDGSHTFIDTVWNVGYRCRAAH